MLAKCANPACDARFLYLREGKLYQIGPALPSAREAEHNPSLPAAEERKSARRLEFFWLCGRCAQYLTLVFDRSHGVVTVPLRSQRAVAS